MSANPALAGVGFREYDLAEVLAIGGRNAVGWGNDPDVRACPPASQVSTDHFIDADIAEVTAWSEGENDERDWLLVGRLNDGRWFAIVAGCDYTGWDCQSWGVCHVAQSHDDLARFGLDDRERERLGIALGVKP